MLVCVRTLCVPPFRSAGTYFPPRRPARPLTLTAWRSTQAAPSHREPASHAVSQPTSATPSASAASAGHRAVVPAADLVTLRSTRVQPMGSSPSRTAQRAWVIGLSSPNGRATRSSRPVARPVGSVSSNARASTDGSSLKAPARAHPSHPPPSQRAQTTRTGATTRTVAPSRAQPGGTTRARRTRAPGSSSSAARSRVRASSATLSSYPVPARIGSHRSPGLSGEGTSRRRGGTGAP